MRGNFWREIGRKREGKYTRGRLNEREKRDIKNEKHSYECTVTYVKGKNEANIM